MTSEELEAIEEELTPLHCAAHDALGKLNHAQGYVGTPHWLCCSSEAKSLGLGFLYAEMLTRGLAFADIVPTIEKVLVGGKLFTDWKRREIEAAKSRAEATGAIAQRFFDEEP
jgi:hypothetical protein